MTNEPPTDGTPAPDGDEQLDADQPGTSDGAADSGTPGDSVDPAIQRGWSTHSWDVAERMADIIGRQEPDPPPAVPPSPDPLNQPVEDSVIDDLKFDLQRAAAGIPADEDLGPDAHAAPPDPELDEFLDSMQPLQDNRVRRAIETEISDESRARQAEADRERTSTEDMAAWDELQPRPELIYDRQQMGDLPEFTTHTGGTGGPSTLQLLIVAGLAMGGIVLAFALGLGPLGGSDDDSATSLPAATIAATAAPTEAASSPTTAPTEVVSEAPAIASEANDLTLLSINAFSDGVGDLWLGLELQAPLGLNPDALEFVHGFAVGAALQTDAGYDGFYFSFLDGDTYGEAVFGSPDFPRTSNTFNASYQIAAPDLWLTEDGWLAIHLLGDAAGNGVDATLFGPDAVVIAGATVVEREGGAAIGGFDQYSLGPVTAGGDLPLDTWTEWEPQQHPLRLDIPDTSNRN
jgi:hypothetical protein